MASPAGPAWSVRNFLRKQTEFLEVELSLQRFRTPINWHQHMDKLRKILVAEEGLEPPTRGL